VRNFDERGQLTTQLTMEYSYNGAKYAVNHSLVENDYS